MILGFCIKLNYLDEMFSIIERGEEKDNEEVDLSPVSPKGEKPRPLLKWDFDLERRQSVGMDWSVWGEILTPFCGYVPIEP